MYNKHVFFFFPPVFVLCYVTTYLSAQLEELSRKQMSELTGEVSTVQIAIEKALQHKRKQRDDGNYCTSYLL